MDNSVFQDWSSAPTVSTNINQEFESPFVVSPTQEQVSFAEEEVAVVDFESPFLPSVQLVEGEAVFDQREQLFVQLLDELPEEEFTEGVVDLFTEGERYLEHHLGASLLPEAEVGTSRREELLQGHFHPLAVAMETLTDRLLQEFSGLEDAPLTEGLIDQAFSRHMLAEELGNPVFEDFFKKAFRKIKRAAKKVGKVIKKGVKLAKKFHPVAVLLRKVKKMVRPFLTKIIRRVIRRLPAALRSPARMLARKLGVKAELGLSDQEMTLRRISAEGETYAYPAGPDLEFIEREFDLRLAEQLFASTEEEARAVFAAYQEDSEFQEGDFAAEERLLEAREQLKRSIQGASTAEEVGPAVEQFVGVAMKAIKVGIRLIGRQKVINAIAKLFTRFIGKLIGPKAAGPLAKALVEKGFRLLNLEVSDEEAQRAPAEVIVQMLEEMLVDVARLDEEVLDNQELLEQEVYHLFRHYSGRNMPSNMVVAELQEAEQAAAWMLLPKNGRKRYKKYSRIMEASLTRSQIAGVRSFNGQRLRTFLRRNYQYQGDQPLRVRIHLYEAVRGTTLSYVSLLEKGTPGLGSARRAAWSQLHPLTPAAASLLLGNSALGQRVGERWLTSRHRIRPGQRFY